VIKQLESPPPFPRRSFASISIAWVSIDLLVMLTLFVLAVNHGIPARGSVAPVTSIVWFAVLSARFLLLLGWLALGEGEWHDRATGLLSFGALLVPLFIGACFEPQILCVGLGMLLFVAVAGGFLSLPYLVLAASDYRLARDLPTVEHSHRGQFTVRQLMVVTLAAAIVLGLLRWASLAQLNNATAAVEALSLGFVFPLAATGLLLPRLYPWALYPAGLTAFLVVLPILTVHGEEAWIMALFATSYATFIVLHLVFLRQMGFRLTNQRPRRGYDPGITFLEQTLHNRGIVFVDTRRDPGVVFLDEEDCATTMGHVSNPAE
jgi:hypothetical protein